MDAEVAFVLGQPGWDQTVVVNDQPTYCGLPLVDQFDAMLRDIVLTGAKASDRSEAKRQVNWLDWLKGIEQRRRLTCRS